MNEKVGICIKALNQIVEFQNPLCEEVCGQQRGKKCETGCMAIRFHENHSAEFSEGIKLLRNAEIGGRVFDAVVINDNEIVSTFLYEKKHFVQKQIDKLKAYHLSQAELLVMEKFLHGYSNVEIAKQLFISKSTLRTHLNNIYKKIPNELKIEIQAAHFGADKEKK